MNKVLAIARAEFLEAVRSKVFLIGIFFMPVLMGGAVAFQAASQDHVELEDRVAAVVDPTGALWPILQQAVEERNAEIWSANDEGKEVQTAPRFRLELHEPAPQENTTLLLSDRVRADELTGFFVLGEAITDLEGEVGERPIAYYTDEPTYRDLRRWVGGVVNGELRRLRFSKAGVDEERVERLAREIPMWTGGLSSARDDGTVEEAQRENEARTFGVPLIGLMLIFMIVMTSAPQLMNQVLEEKMQRISEVLVSAVSPFQLMMGKLLGSVCICLTLAGVYLGGIAWASNHFPELEGLVPTQAYVWFLVMMVFALLMYGSLFSALGSACSELRDAQTLMMPAMVIIMIPMFAFGPILQNPNGSIAQVITFIPTATPMVLLLRLLAPPGPETWEVIVGLAICVLTTLALVWASGKIFRIGILSQGQTPSFRKLLTWVVAK